MRGLEVHTLTRTEYVSQFNELRCSSFHLTPAQMETYYQQAVEFGPMWLRCYPSAGYLFARYLEVEPTVVTDWAQEGRIPAVRESNGWKVDRRELDEWIANGKIK